MLRAMCVLLTDWIVTFSALVVFLCVAALSESVSCVSHVIIFFFFFQAEDGIRDLIVTGVQTCALPIYTVPSCPEDDRAAIPIGSPCAGEELLVLNERFQPVPPGEVGDLYIRGVGDRKSVV